MTIHNPSSPPFVRGAADLGPVSALPSAAGYADGTTAWVGATQYVVSGGAWVGVGSPRIFPNYSSLPAVANDADIAYIPQLVGRGHIPMEYTSAGWEVAVGGCIINAHDYFTVDPVSSTAAVILDFQGDSSLIKPNQIWECNSHATGVVAGASSSGYRTQFGGTSTNTAKATLNQATPRGYERKVISQRSAGGQDMMAVGVGAGSGVNEGLNSALPIRVLFEPGQIGDSFVLRHYSLRRIG